MFFFNEFEFNLAVQSRCTLFGQASSEPQLTISDTSFGYFAAYLLNNLVQSCNDRQQRGGLFVMYAAV